MHTHTAPDHRTEWRAVVDVRVPPTDGDDLVTSARRRLADVDDVQRVAVEDLQGIEPGMPATTVTLAVRVEAGAALTDESVASRLGDAPGAEAVATVRPA